MTVTLLGLTYNPQTSTEYIASLDPNTGVVTQLGSVPGDVVSPGSSWTTSGDDFYFEGEAFGGPRYLYVANETTGQLISSVALSDANFAFNHFDSSTGTLLGLTYNPQTSTEYVASLDPDTGVVTQLGAVPGDQLSPGGGWTTAGNDFYFAGGAFGGPRYLYVANETTGQLISSVALSDANFAFNHFDSSTGTLLGLTYDPQTSTEYVASLDPNTGVVTQLGAVPGDQLSPGGGWTTSGNDFYFAGGAFGGPHYLYIANETTGQLISSIAVQDTYFAFQAAITPAPLDFTGNGTSGVLLQGGSNLIDWSLSNGAYSGYNAIGDTFGFGVLGTGDFNGDGTSDMLFQSSLSDLYDWTMQSGTVTAINKIANPAAAGYGVVGTGDFDGNGTADILLQDAGQNLIDWTMQNGHYAGWNEISNPAPYGYGVVGTGDFNADGTTDVLLQAGSGSIIDWTLRNGQWSGSNQVGNPTPSGYGLVGTGDFNGDSTSDILLENGNDDLIDWIMQNGVYSSYNPIGNTSGYGVVGTGDYNDDGTSDILLQNASGNVIDWIMKNGQYSGWNEVGGAGGYAVVNK
jgi:hypothetical protein